MDLHVTRIYLVQESPKGIAWVWVRKAAGGLLRLLFEKSHDAFYSPLARSCVQAAPNELHVFCGGYSGSFHVGSEKCRTRQIFIVGNGTYHFFVTDRIFLTSKRTSPIITLASHNNDQP